MRLYEQLNRSIILTAVALNILFCPPARSDDGATLRNANDALAMPPLSVTQSPVKAPGGDPHDYVTLSTYAWPNPASPDGLPYIMRDGQINPETGRYPDRKNLQRMVTSVRYLVSGWRATHDKRYAQKAIEWIDTWFLNPATRMNPNLNYSQIVPGKNKGRGNPSGLIETHNFTDLLESVATLEQSYPVPENTRAGLRYWFRHYINWLRTSDIGRGGARFRNNQATWYAAQQVAIYEFLGDNEAARSTLSGFLTACLPSQIRRDGAQPEELKRTNGFNYSVLNLEALFRLALLGQKIGVDVWHYTLPNGAGLEKALDFLVPYATGAQRWPYREIHPYDTGMMKSVLHAAAKAYPEKSNYYESPLNNLRVF